LLLKYSRRREIDVAGSDQGATALTKRAAGGGGRRAAVQPAPPDIEAAPTGEEADYLYCGSTRRATSVKVVIRAKGVSGDLRTRCHS
jgi:hypothetical protein